jgi:hypothetical protein
MYILIDKWIPARRKDKACLVSTFWTYLVLLFLTLSCTEIPPVINPLGQSEQPVDSTARKVLIEEFTGVRCVNCPAGTAEVLRLQEQYQGQVIAVALHAGSFAQPYPDSRLDFRIPETASLLTYLKSPLGYPSAVVNRRLFDGERDLQLSKSLWPVFVEEEASRPAEVRLELLVQYDDADREVFVEVAMTALEEITVEPLKISVMLVEDRVADVQLTPEGKQSDYVHRHNLRDMLTAFNGNGINGGLPLAETTNRNYFYTLSPEWRAEECAIIAFVHLDGEVKDVLQVEKRKLIE